MEILIDGYDFTNDAYELPVIDSNVPEWGQIKDGILNEALKLRLPIKFANLFTYNNQDKHTITVKDDNNNIQFNGFIDTITTSLNDVTLDCKNETSVLFNSYLGSDDYAYVIDDAYPIDIIKELLVLSGLTLNQSSYDKALYIQKALGMKFSVTADSINFAELLENICEVTCGILYIDNDEFYYEQFDPEASIPAIEFTKTDWVDYPVIDTPPVFGSVFNGAEVTYGDNLTLKGLENASKKVDMGTSSSVYTSSGVIAQYICDLYDYLGNHQKQKLTGSIRRNVSTIMNKRTYFRWNDIKYKLVNMNNKSSIKTNIIAEAIL